MRQGARGSREGRSVQHIRFTALPVLPALVVVAIGILPFAHAQNVSTPGGSTGSALVAPTVRITAPRVVTPLPGLMIEREQMSTNVQTATGKEIEASRASSLTDFMNTNMQSVNINDYRGNPFQQDLNYRGFTASPSIGTPQGISVYVDGVRVNEPFGEVVNWDLIPLNAIRRMEIMPGSNPLFGLNTLGGALSITTKDGFTDKGREVKLLGGSFGRKQAQASIGGNNGRAAGFVSINAFDEDGWRDNSPSTVRQAFAKTGIRGSQGEINLSMIAADNELVGNGVVPEELYRQSRTAVFTSPDQAKNRLLHFNLSGLWQLNDDFSASVMTYRRDFKQESIGGDFWDEWEDAARSARVPSSCPRSTGSTRANGALRVDEPGCANRVPNGIFNFGRSDQKAHGASAQLNLQRERYQVVLGMTHDTSELTFTQKQRLGWIGADRNVVEDAADRNRTGLVALSQDILRNNLTGRNETTSLFMLGIVALTPKLSLTIGGRYNRSRVQNSLISDSPIPMYQFTESLLQRLLPQCGAEKDLSSNNRFLCSSGDFQYKSFNPSAGLSWRATENLNLYGNASRGTRAPSAIELGCARDRSVEAVQTGKLQGCSIPTALASDPYLPQVRAHSFEFGVRGQSWEGGLVWNASAFRTDLYDDILFVSLGKRNRGVFDTFGQTRRQGVEFGLAGSQGRHTFRASYTFLQTTFESSARITNLSNSDSSKAQGVVNEFEVEKGDRIPGVPRDILRLSWGMDVTDRWNLGLTLVAHSFSYMRGNENNEHQAGGTDSDGASVTPRYDPTLTTRPGRRYVGDGVTGGYAIVNFNTSYRVNNAWSVFLRVDNVFDRSYETAGELGLNPFAASRWGARDAAGFNYNSYDWTHSSFIGPGMPRAAWVGVTYSFQPSGG